MDAVRRASREEISLRMLGEYLAELDAAREAASSPRADSGEALARWAELDFPERRSLVERHISKIVVGDDGVEVVP